MKSVVSILWRKKKKKLIISKVNFKKFQFKKINKKNDDHDISLNTKSSGD